MPKPGEHSFFRNRVRVLDQGRMIFNTEFCKSPKFTVFEAEKKNE